MNEYYKEKLEQGLHYQDFVVEKLYDIGLPVISYSSKKFQFLIGENKCGFEIKFDDKMKQTGNIYIEVEEKSSADKENFTKSGIYRSDNTWLYIIGDYSKIYIFSKKHLQILHKKKTMRTVEIPTSKGFLIPEIKAQETLAIKILSL